MSQATQNKPPEFHRLPSITYRQLEVFCEVCREGSYSNAAIELKCTRANVKRVCDELSKAVGRPLFDEGPDKTLIQNSFARGLLGHMGPLSRSLHRLDECVNNLHRNGRILRFAAAGEFFKGGLFSDFLGRLQISDMFRPCFLRIDIKRFRTALLNAECDVYFGVGIHPSDRLDLVQLGPIPWKIKTGLKYRGPQPVRLGDLPKGKWWIANAGDMNASEAVLEAFHGSGACGGKILAEASRFSHDTDEILLTHDSGSRTPPVHEPDWPCYQFAAVLRKYHPYSELMSRLAGAATI